MKFSDIFKMCMDSLRRRKGRTILTVLGVFIGCTSIIVMVSIGAGLKESNDQMIENMGDVTMIEVYGGNSSEAKMDENAVESFREITGVQAVMPKANLGDYSISIKAGINDRYDCSWANFLGVDASALEAMGYEVTDGRYPAEGSDEVLVGQYFAYNFNDTLLPEGQNYVDRWVWDEETQSYNTDNAPDPFFDPLNTEMTLYFQPYDAAEGSTPYSVPLKAVGITKEDYGKGYETSEGIMMDIEAMNKILKDTTGTQTTKFTYSEIYVKVENITEVADIEQEIKDLGYNTYSMQSIRDELEKQTRQIELILGGLGAISLLVAAIGITNTMIMSISERTKEIGIMKAMGCYVRDIRRIFLLEAGSIGLIGGVLGLIFSFIVSVIINLVTFGALSGGGLTWEAVRQAMFGGEGVARTSVITPGLIVFALVFSFMVGLVSGYSPANKAVKISALEAIRNE